MVYELFWYCLCHCSAIWSVRLRLFLTTLYRFYFSSVLDRPCVDSYYKSYNVISYEISLYIDIHKNIDLNVLLIKKIYEAIPTQSFVLRNCSGKKVGRSVAFFSVQIVYRYYTLIDIIDKVAFLEFPRFCKNIGKRCI